MKSAVRTRFRLTRREQACRQIRTFAGRYAALAEATGPAGGRIPIRVPPMAGVDDDMREWSLFMILEHNAIVNRTITEITRCLALNVEPAAAGRIDPRKDVMPSPDPDEEQTGAFRESVAAHLDTLSGLPTLRRTVTRRHPIFGPLDAHGWHCMFALHLAVHLKQADAVVERLDAGRRGPSSAP